MEMKKLDTQLYAQSLLDKITSLSNEINNLRTAYITTSDRVNSLSAEAYKKAEIFLENSEAAKKLAELSCQSSKYTYELAEFTNNYALIESAKYSYEKSQEIFRLTSKFCDLYR